MLTDPANFVEIHLRWFLAFVIALGSAGGWYVLETRLGTRWPGGSSTPGLVFGILGGLIIVFECALWLRKTTFFRTYRLLGTAQFWMKAHIWLGLMVGPLALMHSGFSLGGGFTSVLMWMLAVVLASGLFGLWMQNVVPRWMLEYVEGETVFSQIDLVKRQYADEAARIVFLSCGESREQAAPLTSSTAAADPDQSVAASRVVGAQRRVGNVVAKSAEGTGEALRLANSKVVWQAYEQRMQPFLESRRQLASPLVSRRRSQLYFEALRDNAGEDARGIIDKLEQLCDRSRDLNLQRRFHYLLHTWLVVHLPLSISLLILLAIHVIYALRFG